MISATIFVLKENAIEFTIYSLTGLLLSTEARSREAMGKVGVKLGKKAAKKPEADLNEVVTGEGMQTPLLPGKSCLVWIKRLLAHSLL